MWRHIWKATIGLCICLLMVGGFVLHPQLTHYGQLENRGIRILVLCLCLLPAGVLFYMTDWGQRQRWSLFTVAATVVASAMIFYGLTMVPVFGIDRQNETMWMTTILVVVYLAVRRVVRHTHAAERLHRIG